MRQESDELGRKRAEEVKGAMRHAWSGYEQYAFGADELLPRSKRGKEKWGGMGVTLVDSLGKCCNELCRDCRVLSWGVREERNRRRPVYRR